MRTVTVLCLALVHSSHNNYEQIVSDYFASELRPLAFRQLPQAGLYSRKVMNEAATKYDNNTTRIKPAVGSRYSYPVRNSPQNL